MTSLPDIAVSVRQPWAWAIIHAGKDIENRSLAAVKHGMKPGRIVGKAWISLAAASFVAYRSALRR